MTWKVCPFCDGQGFKGIVPIMCTEEEFLYLNYLAKKYNLGVDSVFVEIVRERIKKRFPDWQPYHPLEHKAGDMGLAEVDGELTLVERK